MRRLAVAVGAMVALLLTIAAAAPSAAYLNWREKLAKVYALELLRELSPKTQGSLCSKWDQSSRSARKAVGYIAVVVEMSNQDVSYRQAQRGTAAAFTKFCGYPSWG